MLMEVDTAVTARDLIVEAVEEGRISEDRINDAVRRILKVKIDAGVMDDPLFKNLKTTKHETGSKEYRDVAEKLVEESLVLVKNKNQLLPLKRELLFILWDLLLIMLRLSVADGRLTGIKVLLKKIQA